MSSYLSFDVQVQTSPLFPSVLALKHASSDLKPFAIPLYMFSAGSGSQKASPFQAEGKRLQVFPEFQKYQVYCPGGSDTSPLKSSPAIVKMLLKLARKCLLLRAGRTVPFLLHW